MVNEDSGRSDAATVDSPVFVDAPLLRHHRVDASGERLPEVVTLPPLEEPRQAGVRGLVQSLLSLLYREALKFGIIGLVAFVVDTYVYNLLRSGLWPLTEAPLAHKPLICKVISVSVATVVAWLGNRYWTFRHRRRASMRSEFVLFAVLNVAGLLIALSCLWVSHYLLGFTSVLADNISGNGFGLVLGTLFRFWAYRTFVFTDED